MAMTFRVNSLHSRSIASVVPAASLPLAAIDDLNTTVGGGQIEYPQHLRNGQYVATLDKGNFPFGDQRAPLEPTGQNIKWIGKKKTTTIILLMFITLLEATPAVETCREVIVCIGYYTCCDVPPTCCCFSGVRLRPGLGDRFAGGKL
ncbi:uncharacterized protein LOC143258219 [Tachypleus tridentatus]|uniref:uncharacterized protein LOC143258219 n=1 Tax=Tachypleus tridentatus TaxID=6853 RepID=UPI003FD4F609